MIGVYEEVPRFYISFVVDNSHGVELHAEYLDYWILRAVQNDRLEVTSAGIWIDLDSDTQITLTPCGYVRLVSRDRLSPDRQTQ